MQQIPNLFYKVKKTFFAVMDFLSNPPNNIHRWRILYLFATQREERARERKAKKDIISCQLTGKGPSSNDSRKVCFFLFILVFSRFFPVNAFRRLCINAFPIRVFRLPFLLRLACMLMSTYSMACMYSLL